MPERKLGPAAMPERFTLLRRLGGGGMGEVYEAVDNLKGGRIALKSLHGDDDRFLRALKREFRAAQRVSHPNLVKLLALFEGVNSWFITMELLEGPTFMNWLRPSSAAVFEAETETVRLNAMSPKGQVDTSMQQRLRIGFTQLARAVLALNEQGLVHRDVKPSNIMVTDGPRVVLLDLGLTRPRDDGRQDWTQVGTPSFMAPEQASSLPVTSAADCYAMGVMLYQGLTGRLPFAGSTQQVLALKRAAKPVPPHRFAPAIPADLERLCLELLEPDPAKRPGAAEVLARLSAPSSIQVRSVAKTSLVGREREIGALRDMVALSIEQSRPALGVIEGESGIGKTAVLNELARQCEAEGFLVLRGQCFEAEVSAFPGFDMIVETLAAHLERQGEHAAYFTPRYLSALTQVFPDLRILGNASELAIPTQPGSHELRVRAAGAFAELFARLASRHRLLITLDDAQWLTDDGLLLLRALFNSQESFQVTLVLTFRQPSVAALCDWFAELDHEMRRIHLRPLEHHDSVELLRRHVPRGHRSEEFDIAARESRGHPYFIQEIARALSESSIGTFSSVDEIIRLRVLELSVFERQVLLLVCSAARPVRSDVIAVAANARPTELDLALTTLTRRRWLVAAPSQGNIVLLPAHDRVRSALLGSGMDGQGRLSLSLALAEAIEQTTPDDAEALAYQWADAQKPQRAAASARRAADNATKSLAFDRAAVLLQLAARGAASPSEHLELTIARADALANSGRGMEAAECYLDAAKEDPRRADDLTILGADQLIRSGRVSEGKRLTTEVLERLRINVPRTRASALAGLLLRRVDLKLHAFTRHARPMRHPAEVTRRIDACWLIGDLLAVLDPLRAAALHTQGLQLAMSLNDPYRLARSLCTEAVFTSMPGGSTGRAALTCLAHAQRLAQELQHPLLDGYLSLGHGVVQLQLGNFEGAQRHFDSAEQIFEQCPNSHWETGSAREFALWTASYRGAYEELASRFDPAVKLLEQRGDLLGKFKLMCGPSHVLLLAADQPERVLESARLEPLGLSAEEYPFLAFCALFARVDAYLYLRRPEDALAEIETTLPLVHRAHLLHSQFSRVDFSYLHARVAIAMMAEGKRLSRSQYSVISRNVDALLSERVAWADALAETLRVCARMERSRLSIRESVEECANRSEAVGLRGIATALRVQMRGIGSSSGPQRSGWPSAVRHPDRLAEMLAPLASHPSVRS